MKETAYAKLIATASLPTGNNEARIERLEIKESGKAEIRFSWWKDGKFMPRALDLSEDDLVRLIRAGLRQGVLGKIFLNGLKSAITEAEAADKMGQVLGNQDSVDTVSMNNQAGAASSGRGR